MCIRDRFQLVARDVMFQLDLRVAAARFDVAVRAIGVEVGPVSYTHLTLPTSDLV